MSAFMKLKDALAAIAAASEPVLLRSAGVDWEAQALLDSLPERKARTEGPYMRASTCRRQ